MFKNMPSTDLSGWIDDQPTVMLYAVSGTVVLLVLVLIAILLAGKQRVNKMNW
jgi:hypothetical protein